MKFGANRLNRTTQCSDNHKTDALLIGSFNELQRRGFDVAHLPQDVRQSPGSSNLTWRQAALAIDDADLAEEAYRAVCQQVDSNHYICRVYLDDLAELLVLPPLVYRRIRRESLSEEASQIAA